MRAWFLLLLAGCAAAGPGVPPEARPLDALRERTNAYRSFHYVAEFADAKAKVRLELGWRAPDRAFLRYGSSYATYYAGGVGHYYRKQGYLKFDAAAELARLRKEVGDVPLGGEPEPAFLLTQWDAPLVGKAIRATLGLQRLGGRLGWLAELDRWRAEGAVYRKEPVEIELREDGFLARVAAGAAAELKAVEVAVDAPLDDALFEPPPREGLADLPPEARKELLRSLEDSYRRWALETDAGNATILAFVKADVARYYEPENMLAVQRDGLAKNREAWKKETPDATPAYLREKLEIERGKVLGSVDRVIEPGIQADFERALDQVFRGMAVLPPRAFMQDVASRWREITAREVKRQIRDPLEKLFDDAAKE